MSHPGPCPQYFMRHPRHLFGRPIERAQVDPHNPAVLGERQPGSQQTELARLTLNRGALAVAVPLKRCHAPVVLRQCAAACCGAGRTNRGLMRGCRVVCPSAEAHLACAAAEAPLLLDDDQRYFGPGITAPFGALVPCCAMQCPQRLNLGRRSCFVAVATAVGTQRSCTTRHSMPEVQGQPRILPLSHLCRPARLSGGPQVCGAAGPAPAGSLPPSPALHWRGGQPRLQD